MRKKKARAKKGAPSPEEVRREWNAREALVLRRDGVSVPDIAARFGLGWQEVSRLLRTAVEELVAEKLWWAPAERALMLSRLDRWLEVIEPKLSKGDPRAIRTALEIEKRRAALMGLDLEPEPPPPPPPPDDEVENVAFVPFEEGFTDDP